MSVLEQVRCVDVTRAFERTRALRGIDLSMAGGAITAMVGPNGAGKTTLVSILSTMLRPSTGEVRYGEMGHREASRALRGRIGLVSHRALLYPELSALENLAFAAQLYNLRGAAARARELLERIGLPQGAWRRPAGTLSRGMTQRLALARAMLHDPCLLLLDEPFTGLDPEAADRLEALLAEARRRGRIVLLVTHDFDLAARLSDRIAILLGGRVAHVTDQRLEGDELRFLYEKHTAAKSFSSIEEGR